eukprot:gene31877-7086_t
MILARAAVLACLASVASACIHMFGTSYDHESFDYKTNGKDWTGTCATGMSQSPINIPKAATNGDHSLRTTWDYPSIVSDGTNIDIINNGHVLQVQWTTPEDMVIEVSASSAEGATITDILNIPSAASGTKRVKGMPLHFHFHTGSEHYMFGHDYPMEMHIVQTVPESELAGCSPVCYVVTGILFELVDGPPNPAIAWIMDNLPLEERTTNKAPAGITLDFDALLPVNRAYYQYSGSLTTPPCSEGLLWHVFQEASYMNMDQYNKIMMAVNDKDCTANTTATADHDSRKLHSHVNQHSMSNLDKAMSKLSHTMEVSVAELPRVRFSESGELIEESSPLRVLLQDHEINMVCFVFAYSRDFRLTQPINNRIVKYFADPTFDSVDTAMAMPSCLRPFNNTCHEHCGDMH